jgi:hypothetical protein
MKSTVYWNMTPCSLIEVRWHFGGTSSSKLKCKPSRWQGISKRQPGLCGITSQKIGLLIVAENLTSLLGHVGFVVDKVALGQVFSEYFGFPCQSSFHQIAPQSSSSIIWGLYNRPEVTAAYSGLSPTPLKNLISNILRAYPVENI